MARNLDPKCKQCRRIGEKLFLKGDRCSTTKCAIIKKNYPPGMHGAKGKIKKQSVYGQQLKEKQKAKKIYGLMEKQFRNYYTKAKKTKGNTSENLIRLLNLRFDNIVYQGGLATSRTSARMLITQGHFQIDKNNVNIPSYQLKPGQQIGIKDNKKTKKYWQNNLPLIDKKERPNWLDFDNKSQILKIISFPETDKIESIFDSALIIEFYSK